MYSQKCGNTIFTLSQGSAREAASLQDREERCENEASFWKGTASVPAAAKEHLLLRTSEN